MRVKTKQLLLSLCAFSMLAAAVPAMATIASQKAFAEENSENASGIVTEFTASDSTVTLGDALCEYVTDVDTDDDGNVDAATALKYTIPENASWQWLRVQFNEPASVSSIYELKLRLYVHSTESTTTAPIVWIKAVNDTPVKWMDAFTQGEWFDAQFTRAETLTLADASDGKIKGFTVGFWPGDNAALYSESYLLFDSVTYDSEIVPMTLDNDYANTGIETTVVPVSLGERITAPTSQVFGKQVTWYSDAARTVPFDFENTKAISGLTLYGKYETLVAKRGVVAECTMGDTKYLELPLSNYPDGTNGVLKADHISYVTNVDTDGDGVIDAENAIKISNWTQWHGFALQFATPVDMSQVAKVIFRVYFDLGVTAGSIWAAEGANYKDSVLAWQDVVQGQWWEVSVSADDMLGLLAGEDGQFDSLAWILGFFLESGQSIPQDAYMLIDSITYEWKCNVTFDCDTANSGVANVEKVYSSGKKITTAPKTTGKEGYDVEWYADAERTIPFDIRTERIQDDLTIYAKYVVKQLSVTFDHGETESGIASQTVTVTYGDKVSAPENTRDGYTLAWYTDAACTMAFDFETPITEDMKLYAKYTKIETPSKSGCGSETGTGLSVAMMTIVCGTLFLVMRKKKED